MSKNKIISGAEEGLTELRRGQIHAIEVEITRRGLDSVQW